MHLVDSRLTESTEKNNSSRDEHGQKNTLPLTPIDKNDQFTKLHTGGPGARFKIQDFFAYNFFRNYLKNYFHHMCSTISFLSLKSLQNSHCTVAASPSTHEILPLSSAESACLCHSQTCNCIQGQI